MNSTLHMTTQNKLSTILLELFARRLWQRLLEKIQMTKSLVKLARTFRFQLFISPVKHSILFPQYFTYAAFVTKDL